MYLYETHLHTSQGSLCGHSTGAEMARGLKNFGYAGTVVTDHFFNGNCAIDRSLPWEEKVRRFCLGYYDCLEEGKHLGLEVFFGFEWYWCAAEFLIFGLEPDFLYAHPDCDKLTPWEFYPLVKEAGGIAVQAHPFRKASWIPRAYLFPNLCDGIEALNGGGSHRVDPEINGYGLKYALQFGKPITAGSDVHSAEDLHGVGMEFAAPVGTQSELMRRILTREGHPVCPFPVDALFGSLYSSIRVDAENE